jgi:hypothetical protein
MLLLAALVVLIGAGIALYGAIGQGSRGTTVAGPADDCASVPAARIILATAQPTPSPETLRLGLPGPVLVEPTRCTD